MRLFPWYVKLLSSETNVTFGDAVERVQPAGVDLVFLFTVLTALGAWFFAFLFFGFATGNEGNSLWFMYAGLIAALGALLFADAVLVFRGMRVGYFLSMASWIVLLVFGIWLGYWFVLLSANVYWNLLIVYLVLYPFLSFAYFSTKRVKTYFSI